MPRRLQRDSSLARPVVCGQTVILFIYLLFQYMQYMTIMYYNTL